MIKVLKYEYNSVSSTFRISLLYRTVLRFLQNRIISMYSFKGLDIHVYVGISHRRGNEVKCFQMSQDKANWKDVEKRTTG